MFERDLPPASAATRAPAIVLLTGFGPFPDMPQNLSSAMLPDVVDACRSTMPGVEFRTAILPTMWEEAPAAVAALVAEHHPDVILHFGVSRDAVGFRVEQGASNVCRSAMDAGGALPAHATLDLDGPERCDVTLPLTSIAAALHARNLPVTLSADAGSYLCNAVLYRSLRAAPDQGKAARTGFIHIPADLSSTPMTHDDLIAGAVAIVRACLADRN